MTMILLKMIITLCMIDKIVITLIQFRFNTSKITIRGFWITPHGRKSLKTLHPDIYPLA